MPSLIAILSHLNLTVKDGNRMAMQSSSKQICQPNVACTSSSHMPCPTAITSFTFKFKFKCRTTPSGYYHMQSSSNQIDLGNRRAQCVQEMAALLSQLLSAKAMLALPACCEVYMATLLLSPTTEEHYDSSR
jgi:hypothetical protein